MQKSEARQLKLAEQLVGFQSDMQGYFNHLSNNLDAILLQLSNLSEAIGLQDDFPKFHKLSCSPPMSSHKTEMEFARLPPNQSMSPLSFSSDDTKLESEVPVEALNHALITAKEVDSFTTKTIEKEEQQVFDEMLERENLEILDAPHMLEEVPGFILVLSNYADAIAKMEVPLSPLLLSHCAVVVYRAKHDLELLQSVEFLPDSKGNFDPGGGSVVFDERPNIYFPCVVANLKTIAALYEEEQKLENTRVFDPGDLGLFSLNVVDYTGEEVIFNGCSVSFSFQHIFSEFSSDFQGCESNHNNYQLLGKIVLPQSCLLLSNIYFVLVGEWIEVGYNMSYFKEVVKAENEYAAEKNETKEMKVDADDSTAEGNLNNLRIQWQRIRERLFLVGMNLPPYPTAFGEGQEPADPAAEICQQVCLNCFVSNSIGMGVAKAEVEMEMEVQIELKKSEIAHLWDMIHYFEVVNQEMSQRNQEVACKIWQQKSLSHFRVVIQGVALSQVNDQYFSDLLMKINARLDGMSFMLAGELSIIDFANIMSVNSNKLQQDMAYSSFIKLEFDQPPLKFLPQHRVLGTRLFQGGSNVVYLARLEGIGNGDKGYVIRMDEGVDGDFVGGSVSHRSWKECSI